MLGFANGNGDLANTQTAAGTAQLAGGTQDATTALGRLTQAAGGDPTANNLSDAWQYAANPFIGSQVRNAMQSGVETARDVTMPGIDQSMSATGNENSSRAGIAQGMVERGLAEQSGNLYGSLAGQNWQSGIQTAEQQREANMGSLGSAAGLGTNLAQLGYSGIGSGVGTAGNLFDLAGSGGAGLTAAQQAQYDNMAQMYGFNTNRYFAPYQAASGIVDPIAGLGGQTSSNSTTTSTPSMYQVLGGLLSAGGNAAAMYKLSDARLKEDIAQVGQLTDGTPIYRYRYKGQKRFEIGLLAQDIEKITPAAVGTDISGFKMVDYKAATQHLVH